MNRLAIAAVGLALMVGVVGLACGGGQEEPPEVPPQGIRATIPAEVPQIEEARLRQLTLEPADLPPGFELQNEDVAEEGGTIHYIAHYMNEQISPEDFVRADVPITIDVLVFLFDDEASSTAFFTTLQSSSSDALGEYTQVLRRRPEEDLGVEQKGVQAAHLQIEGLGDDSLAWQVSETVRFPDTDTDTKFVDATVCIRRGRAVGMVDIGMVDRPPPTADIETLAAKLDQHLAMALR